MTVRQLILGRLSTNCWIIEQNGRCAVIDPAAEGARIAEEIEKAGLSLSLVLFTHGHFDHVLGAPRLLENMSAPVYMHPADEFLLPGGVKFDRELADGDEINFAEEKIRVLHTPGHTPGSCAFIAGGMLFSGDTLFAGSFGRYDLPGGSAGDLRASLLRLGALEGDMPVFPGHGEKTSLSVERAINPYLGKI